MNKKMFILTLIITFIVFINPITSNAESKKSPPEINGKVAIVIDAYDNEILYKKNENEVAYPASITKVLTAILALENIEDGETITVSEKASKEEGSNSQILLKESEEITKEDALHLMMMISSNDASYAVAEHISGSVEEFSKLMNEKAKELGAKNSNFTNPNGLPDANHTTTAYDMALITKELLNHPELIKVMQKETYKLKTNEREVTVQKSHSIFERNEMALVGKTGWTQSSGNTLVEIFKEKNKYLISVVMGASGRDYIYEDMNNLADYTFPKTELTSFFKKGDLVSTISNEKTKINLYANEDIIIKVNNRKNIPNKIKIKETKSYKSGDVIGHLEIYDDKRNVEKSFELYSDKDILTVSAQEKKGSVDNIKSTFEKSKGKITKSLFIILSIPIVVFSVIISVIKIFQRRS